MRRPIVISIASLSLPAVLALGACASAPREPWPSPTSGTSSSAAPGNAGFFVSPIPVVLTVPVSLAPRVWVGPLTGADIDALAPAAAAQVEYRDVQEQQHMAGNLMWFTVARFQQLMAGADAPKGIALGLADGHVLFLQPALDMPFEPSSADATRFGQLVTLVREFDNYTMRDSELTLLRPCPSPDAWPRTDVPAAVRRVIDAYFAAKDLGPVTLQDDQAWVLDVAAQAKGTHRCANPDGGEGGYVGAVPDGALEALMVYAHHAPYPVTGSAWTFVTLARMPQVGWLVVGEGTGP